MAYSVTVDEIYVKLAVTAAGPAEKAPNLGIHEFSGRHSPGPPAPSAA
jgi:hypothetical protein